MFWYDGFFFYAGIMEQPEYPGLLNVRWEGEQKRRNGKRKKSLTQIGFHLVCLFVAVGLNVSLRRSLLCVIQSVQHPDFGRLWHECLCVRFSCTSLIISSLLPQGRPDTQADHGTNAEPQERQRWTWNSIQVILVDLVNIYLCKHESCTKITK